MADQEGTITMSEVLERELALEEEAEAKLQENWGDEKYVPLLCSSCHSLLSIYRYIYVLLIFSIVDILSSAFISLPIFLMFILTIHLVLNSIIKTIL